MAGARLLMRWLLVWLVAAALPLQGFAAATQVACHSAHRPAAATMDVSDRHSTHGHSMHAAAGPHDQVHARTHVNVHGQADQHPIADAPAADNEHDAVGPHGPAQKCSACAPCCAAAAPAPAWPQWRHPAAAPVRALFEGTHYTGVVADVPHHPPRQHLA
jgi:hypothetical protein